MSGEMGNPALMRLCEPLVEQGLAQSERWQLHWEIHRRRRSSQTNIALLLAKMRCSFFCDVGYLNIHFDIRY